MMETLRVTTLGNLTEGVEVNVERAARIGDEIGATCSPVMFTALPR